MSIEYRATETILSGNGVIEMDKFSKGYLLLQEIRDESHRFAITAQRKKENKSVKTSFLDEINGVGPVTKNNLLKKFKNISNIKSARLEELMTINGINEKIAKKTSIKTNVSLYKFYYSFKDYFWSNYFYSFNKNRNVLVRHLYYFLLQALLIILMVFSKKNITCISDRRNIASHKDKILIVFFVILQYLLQFLSSYYMAFLSHS